MTEIIRYSPKPISSYMSPGLLTNDPEGWNLAWLSHDWGNGPPRDPNFTTLVRRTTQIVLETGELDLAGQLQDHLRLRGMLRMPPEWFVKQLLELPVLPLPLLLTYGREWLSTVSQRARLYREPFDERFDGPVPNIALPAEVLNALR